MFKPLRPLLFPILLSAITASGTHAAVAAHAAGTDEIDYARDIQPLLASHCYECHGPDTQEGRLRLDRHASLLRGGDSGEPAIIPAKPQISHLLRLVRGEEAGKRMPPEPADPLTADQIRLLERWIASGAAWSGSESEPNDDTPTTSHWAFQPLTAQAPPTIDSSWVRNGIDAWILQRLQQAGIEPNPPASTVERIRRLSLSLHGLPPTPADVHNFAARSDAAAWTETVQAALDSPRYGERWAQHWLDLVRFAETNGFETNRERPNAWPYRDYVIRAFNDDKPYNQFLREQIAGDALNTPEATAFLVAGPVDIVKSPDINLTLMQRQNELDDVIGTTASAFLGLTLGCARCHNHKFDPIRQTDYYAVQAVFAGVQHGERNLPPDPTAAAEAASLSDRITSLRRQLQPWLKSTIPLRPAVTATFNEELFPELLARSLRFTIEASSSAQPCIDELQVFSGSANVALESHGTTAEASGTLPGYAIHQLKHIHDGLHGNNHSWIADKDTGWIQLNFPQATPIQRIEWARDREGQFRDRVAVRYRIEAAGDDGVWKTIASSEDRKPFGDAVTEPEYDFSRGTADERRAAEAQFAELRSAEKRRTQLTSGTTIYAGNFRQPGPTHRLFRGEPAAPREQVPPNGISFLTNLPLTEQSTEQERRLAFANWVAADDNPLTARVIVNRLWQWHFGRGLVATPSDFGLAGTPPTHPELLDWLASELVRSNWSIKHIQQLILTSSTWQQNGEPRAAAVKADAATELWWRFPPRRLEAEPIRDCILAVTGVLNPEMFGPGFNAFEVQLENVRHYFPRSSWGPPEWRRMIYQTRVRLEREAVFGIFDCPDAATSVPRRSRSTTPLQALNLFNSSFILQQSELFAQRLQREFGPQPANQITGAFQLCFGRNPDPQELQDSLELIQTDHLQSFCRALLNSNEFVFLP
ncbi:MAG: PSD1 and planctomycete cytochrome C domain-containing protein [Planctomycetaceae bacterium]